MLIIDPGDNAEKIEQKILEMQGKPVAILLTHGHFDHILAAEAIRDRYQIPIYASQKEEKTLQDSKINLTAYHEQLYLKGRCISYGPAGGQTGRIFCTDD